MHSPIPHPLIAATLAGIVIAATPWIFSRTTATETRAASANVVSSQQNQSTARTPPISLLLPPTVGTHPQDFMQRMNEICQDRLSEAVGVGVPFGATLAALVFASPDLPLLQNLNRLARHEGNTPSLLPQDEETIDLSTVIFIDE